MCAHDKRRVIAVDFNVNGTSFCRISVYAPHRGYSAEELGETYNQLRCIVGKTQRLDKRMVIGGVFKTQFGIDTRRLLIDQFV